MDKGLVKQEKHNLHEFNRYTNLWNIIPGGSGKGIVLLRKILDAIQYCNYENPYIQSPSFLLTGSSKRFTARALINSLAIDDIRLCPARYFDNGYSSFKLFYDSFPSTAHVITDIEHLTTFTEGTLWKFLNDKGCSYYSKSEKITSSINCNGLIVLTANQKDTVSEPILRAVDYTVELEPLTADQVLAVIHQRLVFCQVEYEGEEVLKTIAEQGFGEIKNIISALERCLMLMDAELQDKLTLELVQKADKLFCSSVSPSPHK
jgi:hypothetical protein